jgi:hypothetical protein
MPDIFHIIFFPVFSNLNDVISIESTTSFETRSVVRDTKHRRILGRTHFELREFETTAISFER